MTEAAVRVDPQVLSANELADRAPNPPVATRLSDPDWVDWCDADR